MLFACKLNKGVEHSFNNYGVVEARRYMIRLMEEYAEVGAADTEPFGVLENLLAMFYDEN